MVAGSGHRLILLAAGLLALVLGSCSPVSVPSKCFVGGKELQIAQGGYFHPHSKGTDIIAFEQGITMSVNHEGLYGKGMTIRCDFAHDEAETLTAGEYRVVEGTPAVGELRLSVGMLSSSEEKILSYGASGTVNVERESYYHKLTFNLLLSDGSSISGTWNGLLMRIFDERTKDYMYKGNGRWE